MQTPPEFHKSHVLSLLSGPMRVIAGGNECSDVNPPEAQLNDGGSILSRQGLQDYRLWKLLLTLASCLPNTFTVVCDSMWCVCVQSHDCISIYWAQFTMYWLVYWVISPNSCGTSIDKFSHKVNNLGSHSLIASSFPEINSEDSSLQLSSIWQDMWSGEKSFI